MCRRDLDQIPLLCLFYRGRNCLVGLPSPGLSAQPYHQPKRGELWRASDCSFQKKCLSQASALEASVLIYAIFHIQEDIIHFHSGEVIPDWKKTPKPNTNQTNKQKNPSKTNQRTFDRKIEISNLENISREGETGSWVRCFHRGWPSFSKALECIHKLCSLQWEAWILSGFCGTAAKQTHSASWCWEEPD